MVANKQDMYQVVHVLVRNLPCSLHTGHLIDTSIKYTIICYQTESGQIAIFMSGILVPQSCLFFHKSPMTTCTIKADLNSCDRSHRAFKSDIYGKNPG